MDEGTTCLDYDTHVVLDAVFLVSYGINSQKVKVKYLSSIWMTTKHDKGEYYLCCRRVVENNQISNSTFVLRLHLQTCTWIINIKLLHKRGPGFSGIEPFPKGSITFNTHVWLLILTIDQI